MGKKNSGWLAAFYFGSFSFFFSQVLLADNRMIEAKNIDVFLLEGSERLELSGLSFCHNKLLSISDNNNHFVYEVVFSDAHKAALKIFIQLPDLPKKNVSYPLLQQISYWYDGLSSHDRADFEAITCDKENIYLLSERKNDIVKITEKHANWLNVNWYNPLHDKGFLNKYNAYGEGLVKIDDFFYLAIEREERGVFKLTQKNNGQHFMIEQQLLPSAPFLSWYGKKEDLSDLAYDGKYLYTLERNAYAVCKRTIPDFKVVVCFSYASIERGEVYRYHDAKFGMAEGLAVDANFIYIVLDNNGLHKASSPEDARSILIRMEK